MKNIREDYQHPEYLVETDWLQQHLNDSDLRIFDCTAYPEPNPDREAAKRFPFLIKNGRNHFDQEHIPGAGFIDIPGDLSDKSSEIPLTIPSEQQFAGAMIKYGISDDTRVVLYSTPGMIWAARVWWMLREFGFKNVSILNGGWGKWVAESRPVSKEACAYLPGQFTAQARTGTFVDKDNVLAVINDDDVRLIHAMPAATFTGSKDGLVFGRKGRIPGSVNVPTGSLHDPDNGTYLPAKQLREIFAAVNVGNAEKIITYCGSGVNASNNAFTLALLGHDNVAVYDGSMCEWGNDESLPIETA